MPIIVDFYFQRISASQTFILLIIRSLIIIHKLLEYRPLWANVVHPNDPLYAFIFTMFYL